MAKDINAKKTIRLSVEKICFLPFERIQEILNDPKRVLMVVFNPSVEVSCFSMLLDQPKTKSGIITFTKTTVVRTIAEAEVDDAFLLKDGKLKLDMLVPYNETEEHIFDLKMDYLYVPNNPTT